MKHPVQYNYFIRIITKHEFYPNQITKKRLTEY